MASLEPDQLSNALHFQRLCLILARLGWLAGRPAGSFLEWSVRQLSGLHTGSILCFMCLPRPTSCWHWPRGLAGEIEGAVWERKRGLREIFKRQIQPRKVVGITRVQMCANGGENWNVSCGFSCGFSVLSLRFSLQSVQECACFLKVNLTNSYTDARNTRF